jgi:hypothetical protein
MNDAQGPSRAAATDRLATAIVDGRLKLLRGVAPIGRALGMSPTKAKAALLAGKVERAWQVDDRWVAIRPALKPDPAPLLDYIEAPGQA